MNKESFDKLLARAALPVSGEEYERLLKLSDIIDRQVTQLRIPEARYAEPADIYPAGDLR